MNSVTFEDIRLREYSLTNLELLNKLREEHFNAKAEVCIERARHITEYLKGMALPDDAMIIKYAKAVNHFLSNKEPCFFDDNLLAGTTTSKPFGAPVYPELTGMTIWPELDTISTREKNPQILAESDAEYLNFSVFPYWMDRNILEVTRKKHGNPQCIKLFEQFVYYLATKAGCISHVVPDYRVVLEKGVEHIINEAASKQRGIEGNGSLTNGDKQKIEFYQAMQIVLKGIITYAKKLGTKAAQLATKEQDPVRKKNFMAISEICKRVPAKPARSFREAINSLWIIQVAIHAENINMAISPGRLDQVLYPYYKHDIENGTLKVKDAIELLGCLWLRLTDNTNLVPETAEELFGGAGTVPAVTVGGVDENGKDAVNDLTYIMLRVTELLQTRDPSMNARYHYEKNSQTYLNRVAEVIAETKSVPALHNDVVDIETLKNQGTKLEHARDYAVIGCVELTSAGRSYDASSSIMLNLVAVLELTLYNGKRPITGDDQVGPETGDPTQFKSYDEFWEAFTGQLSWLIGQAIQLNNYFGEVHQEILPTPLLSSFFEGPMEKGQDLVFGGALYNSSGATHIGFADTVDSLSAIETAVFIEGKFTFGQLLKAIEANFTGHEKLHAYLVNRTPKYGTDDPLAVKNSQKLIDFLYDFYQAHNNYRGGRYRPGYWTMTSHSGQGKLSGALPNGRKANKVFASGITPVSQATGNLASCLQAVGRLNGLHIPNGEALNLKFPELKNQEDIKTLGHTVESYFKHGGLHVQFNIMSYETLLDAKKHPEKYPELLVRVSGYSAYFNDLNDAMKDEIITRTAYNIQTGDVMPFPESNKSMLSFE